ncbi:hypothetical protein BASA81_012714 [Batrachochytrium salamandrivorans]|nr:hypothetical protein BASA81_012714 [Batrachochytrium salamandrivorans]
MGPKKRQQTEEEEEEEERVVRKSSRTNQAPKPSPSPSPAVDDDDDSSIDFTRSHRELLQYFMLIKVVEEDLLVNRHAALLFGQTMSSAKVLSLISEINSMLHRREMGMEIKPREMSEFPGQFKVWGLVNTRDDEVSKMSTPLDQWEVGLFQCAIKILAKDESSGVVTTKAAWQALKATDNPPAGKSLEDSTACMDKLVKLKWLAATVSPGVYTVGARTLLELPTVLRENGAEECPITKQVVIKTEAYMEWLAAAPK